jgi:uncharacterized membrane protein
MLPSLLLALNFLLISFPMDSWIRALAYMCIGVTGEVIFTSIKALYYDRDLRLQGFTQLWVMPLYFFGSVLIFEPLHLMINDYFVLIRFCIYAFLIFGIEYVAGFIAKLITGACPWQYDGKWNIHGYINLPHFPFWGVLGLMAEYLHYYLTTL